MPTASEVRAIAARIYDNARYEGMAPSDREKAFLNAVSRADDEWHSQLQCANRLWGGGSDAWQAVKRMATRRRDEQLVKALAALEAADFDEFDFTAEAAE